MKDHKYMILDAQFFAFCASLKKIMLVPFQTQSATWWTVDFVNIVQHGGKQPTIIWGLSWAWRDSYMASLITMPYSPKGMNVILRVHLDALTSTTGSAFTIQGYLLSLQNNLGWGKKRKKKQTVKLGYFKRGWLLVQWLSRLPAICKIWSRLSVRAPKLS